MEDTLDQEESLRHKYEEKKEPEKPRQPFNPLTAEQVNEKSYAKPNIKITQAEANTPIPEPVIVPPPTPPKEEPQQKAAPKPPPPPINPKMNDLPPKEKAAASKQGAAMAIKVYEWAHQFLNWSVRINEGKLNRLSKKKKIDLKMPIPVSPTESMTVAEFAHDYNQQLGTPFVVTKEFKEEVTPILERVMEKKGLGLTDEEMLIGIVAKDLVVKAVICIDLVKTKNASLNQLIELTEEYRKFNKAHVTPPPVQTTLNNPPPQQQAQPQQTAQATQAPNPAAYKQQQQAEQQYQSQYTQQQQQQHTPQPQREIISSDEDEAESVEVISEITTEIPEPEFVNRDEGESLIHKEVKPKRAYNKKDKNKITDVEIISEVKEKRKRNKNRID